MAARAQALREVRVWVLVALAYMLLRAVLPVVETRLAPVVSEITVVSAEDAGAGWTRAVVEADKFRDCPRWRRIEWFLGPRYGGGPQVQAYFEDPPQMRPTGKLRWEGLMVRLDKETLLNNSHGDAFHDCYGWELWLSKSFYFDSPAEEVGETPED